jgi:hypothetical protein
MKVIRKVDIRVEIEPDIYPVYGFLREPLTPDEIEKKMMTEAKELLANVQRHVDNSRFAVIRYNTISACSFCGDASEWGDEVPECCQESVDEFNSAYSSRNTKGEE